MSTIDVVVTEKMTVPTEPTNRDALQPILLKVESNLVFHEFHIFEQINENSLHV